MQALGKVKKRKIKQPSESQPAHKKQKTGHHSKKKINIESRFRFASSTKQIQAISIDAHTLLKQARESTLANVEGLTEDDLLDTPLGNSLQTRALLDASLPFKQIYRQLGPKTRSLPLILHHLDGIVQCLRQAMNDDGNISLCGESVFALLLALLQTITSEDENLQKYIPSLIQDLVSLAFRLSNRQPKWVEHAFGVLALVFKDFVRISDPTQGPAIWELVKHALGAFHTDSENPMHVDDSASPTIDEQEEIAEEDDPARVEDEVDKEPTESAVVNLASVDTMAEDTILEVSADQLEKDVGIGEDQPATESKQEIETIPLAPSRMKGQPHLRHLLASTLGFYVRRLSSKRDSLDAFVSAIDADLRILSRSAKHAAASQMLSESVSWLIFESCRGIEHRLHTKAGPVFRGFAEFAVFTSESTVVLGSVRHGLTALIHHSRAEYFDAVTAIIFEVCQSSLTEHTASSNFRQQARSMQLLTTLSGVRRGSRIQESRRPSLFKLLSSFSNHVESADAEWHAAFVSLAIVVLHQAKLAEMLNQGGKSTVTNIFSHKAPLRSSAMISLGLHRVSWPLATDFIPEQLVHRLLHSLGTSIDSALLQEMIALSEAGYFDRISSSQKAEVWQFLAPNFANAAREWRDSAALTSDTVHLQALLRLVPVFGNSGEGMSQTLVGICSSSIPSNESATFSAQADVIACALNALSTTRLSTVTLPVNDILQISSDSTTVLDALTKCIPKTAKENLPDFATISNLLGKQVASTDSKQRTAAMNILAALAVDDADAQTASILADCERIPLSFQDSREKCLAMRRVKGLYDAGLPSYLKALIIQFLYGCTALPILPVAKEAVTAFSAISRLDSNVVWEEIGRALVDDLSPAFLLASAQSSGQVSESSDHTMPSSFRCSYLERVLQTENTEANENPIQRVKQNRALDVLAAAPAFFERHNRNILPMFFDLYEACKPQLATKQSQELLLLWLDALSNLQNPKALFKSQEIYATHSDLLKRPEVKMQKAALRCLATWKQPSVEKMGEVYEVLLDSSKLRDTLMNLRLDGQDGEITGKDRQVAISILIRLLYGIMTSRFGSPGKRTAILNALRPLADKEIDEFVDLMIESVGETPQEDDVSLSRRAVGFLSTLADLLPQLGARLKHRFDQLLDITVNLARQHAQNKKVRSQIFTMLVALFRNVPDIRCDAQLQAIFDELVLPKTKSLEANELPEAVLTLASMWSVNSAWSHLLYDLDANLIPVIASGFNANLSPSRLEKTLSLFEGISQTQTHSGETASNSAKNVHTSLIVDSLGKFLAQAANTGAGKQFVARAVAILLTAVNAEGSMESPATVFNAIFALLGKPPRVVSDDAKAGLLKLLKTLLEHKSNALSHGQIIQLGDSFDQTRSDASRQLLVDVFSLAARDDIHLSKFAQFLADINSMSPRRREEPDYERRLQAFKSVQIDETTLQDERIWRTLVACLFVELRDTDDLPLVSSASHCLAQVIKAVANADAQVATFIIEKTMRTIQSKSEQGFQEATQAMSLIVEHFTVNGVSDLTCLLVEGDPEANFFLNINHLQNHRRSRALRRLSEDAEAGKISARALSEYMLPIVRHYIPSYTTNTVNVDLANDAVQCLIKVSGHLSWQATKTLLLQQLQHVKRKPATRKISMRILAGALRSFRPAILAATSQMSARIYLGEKIYPVLLRLADGKDLEDDERLAIIDAASAILPYLTQESQSARAPQLYAILGRELQNKEQKHRDRVRAILCQSTQDIGAESLAWAVKELQSILRFGPQRHILAYVLNALLNTVEKMDGETLAELLPLALPIIETDLFGTNGRGPIERSKGSNNRETRSSKSLDSIGRVAVWVTAPQVAQLLSPVKLVLQNTGDASALAASSDALTSIANGLQKNENLDAFALLDLVRSLIDQNGAFFKDAPRPKSNRRSTKAFIVDAPVQDSANWSTNSQQFIGLGLDILNAAFKRNRFDLHDPACVARLEPLITSVGNALYETEHALVAKGLRAANALLQCPLDTITKVASVLFTKCLSILQTNGNTVAEINFLALRCVTTIMRDCKSVTVTDTQLDVLLSFMQMSDFEDPERQSATFSLLRAVLSRKLLSPGIYDIMEKVVDVMVTNQAAQVREVARASFLQFLLDYPQGKGRLVASFTLLANNLGYTYESGRLSVMEIMHAIFTKFGAEHLTQSSDLFFTSLFLATANDDSSQCRENAAHLITILFGRIDAENQQSQLSRLSTWASDASRPVLSHAAIKLLPGCISQAGTEPARKSYAKLVPLLMARISESGQILTDSTALMEQDEGSVKDLDWQSPQISLYALAKIVSVQSSTAADVSRKSFEHVITLMLHPHHSVRLAASQLIGSLYAEFLKTDGEVRFGQLNLISCARNLTLQLQGKMLTEGLALQCVKVLLAIAAFWAKTSPDAVDIPVNSPEDNDEENKDRYEPEDAPLRWLVDRLARQARLACARRPSPYSLQKSQWSLQPLSVLRWFAAFIDRSSVPALQPFLFSVVTLLYRILDDEAKGDEQAAAVRELTAEVQELLQTKIGKPEYAAVWSQVQQSIARHRQQRAVEAIGISQEAKAKRKESQSQNKMAARKRKSAFKRVESGVLESDIKRQRVE